MNKVITAWIVAASIYVSYAVLALGTTGIATKVWVALLFVIISVLTWSYLRHHHDPRKSKRNK